MTNNQILYFLCIVIKNTLSQMIYNSELEVPPSDAISSDNMKNNMNKMEPQFMYTGDPKSGYILYQKQPPNNVPYTILSNNDNKNKIVMRSECDQCVYPEGCCQYQCPECQRYGNILLTHGYQLSYPLLPGNIPGNIPGNTVSINDQYQSIINEQINPQLNQQQHLLINPAINLPVNTVPYQLNPQINQQMTQQVNLPENLGNIPYNSQIVGPVNSQLNYQNTSEPIPTMVPNIQTITQNPEVIPNKNIRRPIPTTIIAVTNPKLETATEVIIEKKQEGRKSRHPTTTTLTVTTNNTNASTPHTTPNTTSNPKTEATTAVVPVIIIYNNNDQAVEDSDYPISEVKREIEEISPHKHQGRIVKYDNNDKSEHTPEQLNDAAEYYDYFEGRRVLTTYSKNNNHIQYDPYVMVRRTIRNRLPESQILFDRMKDLKLKRAMLPDRKTG